MGHSHRRTVGVIGKVQRVCAYGHLGQLSAVIHIVVGSRTVCLFGAQTIGVIGILPSGRTVGQSGKLPPVFPSVGAYTIIRQVTYGVIGKGASIVASQQVAPLAVAVGIG